MSRSIEAGQDYMKDFRVSVKQPDPNRVLGYINPATVEVRQVGTKKVSVIGGPRGIDINI